MNKTKEKKNETKQYIYIQICVMCKLFQETKTKENKSSAPSKGKKKKENLITYLSAARSCMHTYKTTTTH